MDAAYTVYVSDAGNNRIRAILPSAAVSTIAGNSSSGYADGVSSSALFSFPAGIAVDSAGRLFVADSGNNVIRFLIPQQSAGH